MAYTPLPEDYADAVWSGRKKYRQIHNSDGTVSFEDVTLYQDQQQAYFGAQDANQMNHMVNRIAGKALYVVSFDKSSGELRLSTEVPT